MHSLLRCFLLLLILQLAGDLAAQSRKGSVYLGGGTSFFAQRTGSDIQDAHILHSRAVLGSFQEGGTYRSGYFLTNRLLVGARLSYKDPSLAPTVTTSYRQDLAVEPFLRYYVAELGDKRPVSLFGEIGFATFALGGEAGYETDFHLGIGAETTLAPGLLGTANLNYNANAWGINLTDLNVGMNVLTGQLGGLDDPSGLLSRGTWVTNGQLGSVAYGRMNRDGSTDERLQLDLRPRIGYLLAPGMMVELSGRWQRHGERLNITNGALGPYRYNLYNQVTLAVQARYFPLRRGRFLPFMSATGGADWLDGNGVYGGDFFRIMSSRFLGTGLGAAYFLSDHVAIDVSTTYRRDFGEDVERNGGWLNAPGERLVGEAGLRFYL